MGPVVWLVKATEAEGREATIRLMEELDAAAILRPKSRIMIKLNITANLPPESGVITFPSVLDGALAYLADHGIRNVIVAEGGGDDVSVAFERFGYREVAARYGVPIVDLNRDEAEWVEVPNPLVVPRFSITKTVRSCDAILNLPCLKVHNADAVVTICMKNMMGCIERCRRGEMHKGITQRLMDLLKIVRPTVNVVDGLVGRTWGEIHGEPVGMGVMLAGTDMVAVDAVGAATMDMLNVPHIELAAKHGYGVSDLSHIEVRGEPIGAVRRHFRRRGWNAATWGAEPKA
ncbi:MAG TPA: DUF362 domain-containing protein [Planctomycetota bacterium]|nr:DUF362 domain-containing protein [Planctomycetota bacterium]